MAHEPAIPKLSLAEKELRLWREASNLLCVRLDALGDVLMTVPALSALKSMGTHRHLTLLTSPSGAIAADHLDAVDDIIIYEAPWMKASSARADSSADYDMIQRLSRQQFDAAIIFTVFSQNPLPAAFMCYLAQIPLRAAYCRENPYHLLTHFCPESEPQLQLRHEVRRQLDLVHMLGSEIADERMCITPKSLAIRVIRKLCKERGLQLEKPWVVMHPGATAPSRRYPPAGFAEVACILVEQEHFQVVFTGTSEERGLLDQMGPLLPATGIFDFMGDLNFAQLTALIAITPLLVSNNTAPVHIASSVGTPVVDLYALTNPQHIPWMVPHRVLNKDVPCKYCYKSVCPQGHQHCLTMVRPEEVVAAIIDLFTQENLPSAKENQKCIP
jgi:lipopolysaccharide heptosyltransferase II